MQATRTTWPSMRCTDPAFEYRDSWRTNIAETFAKARERIASEQAAQAKKPRRRTQHAPALMTINRVRAGTTNHLNLQLF
ncbi:MAG: hypothetical protein L0H10_04035 [Comamonas sp.]|uniref:hypothetical protein n=1 Tax=Comamonas sp. TaxID=34028 RepID=UPI002646FE01|nr:hypothetical protein [Comamonas sp.]MDN5502975.1 hypothetical protein [Comamonas sp.]MDN5539607.1 hypothetical protein [Comamonas sp.]